MKKNEGGLLLRLLTIRPPHGIIQVWWQPLPKCAVFRVAQVHTPLVVIIAPVVAVLEEVGFVIVEPNKGCIYAFQW